MLRNLILATGGLLALVVPELFQDCFDGLRQSRYLWLYQAACGTRAAAFVAATVPWKRVLRRRPKARIRVESKPGTARMGPLQMLHKATADLLITNDGPPIRLVTHARLTNVAPGFTWAIRGCLEVRTAGPEGGGLIRVGFTSPRCSRTTKWSTSGLLSSGQSKWDTFGGGKFSLRACSGSICCSTSIWISKTPCTRFSRWGFISLLLMIARLSS